MATQMNMLDYIGSKMDAMDFDGDLNLNWDKDAHVIELEYTMTVLASAEFDIEDNDGSVMDDGKVQYADAVLFYDETRMDGHDYVNDYLTVIPFSGKKGIDQATVDGFFNYFQTVLDEGESDLLDFVDGTSDSDEFTVGFSQSQLTNAVAEEPDAKLDVYLPYPKY